MSSTSSSSATAHAGCSCSCKKKNETQKPVRYADGAVLLDETDLSGRSFGFSWGHTRSYGNQLSRNNTGFNGNSWLVAQVEYLVFLQPDVVAVMSSMGGSVWLRLVDGVWRGELGVRMTMRQNGGDWEVYSQDSGLTNVFYGDSAAWYLRGQLRRVVAPSGETCSISRDGQGRITRWEANDGTSANALRFDYIYYSTGAGSGALKQVTKVATRSGVERNIRRSTYSYYGASPNGNSRDLQSAEIEQWNGSAWTSIRKSFYRYYLLR